MPKQPAFEPQGRPLHQMRATPDWVRFQMQIGQEYPLAYSIYSILGMTPTYVANAIYSLVSARAMFRVAETSGDSSNYTQIDIIAGTAASFRTIATFDTSSNPGAFVIFGTEVHQYLNPDEFLVADFTRVGAARNYAGKEATIILDIVAERQP